MEVEPFEAEYRGVIDDERRKPRRSARQLASAVQGGRDVGAALRHLDAYGSEPEALGVADALARFLVARCDSHHAGWRVVRHGARSREQVARAVDRSLRG
jgi:hypothetical protein